MSSDSFLSLIQRSLLLCLQLLCFHFIFPQETSTHGRNIHLIHALSNGKVTPNEVSKASPRVYPKDLVFDNYSTILFASKEIIHHYSLVGVEIQVGQKSDDKTKGKIVLGTKNQIISEFPEFFSVQDFQGLGEQGFIIEPLGHNKTIITGNQEIGVLYGVYELLSRQGFSWYGTDEIIVPKSIAPCVISNRIKKKPKVNFRGFWTFDHEPISSEFAIWMARNKLNVVGNVDKRIGKTLGIKTWTGEHTLIQEIFSNDSLFGAEPEFFTLYKGKRLKVNKKGSYINPVYANPKVAEYFSDDLIPRLENGDLKDVDILNIWPSDKKRFRKSEDEYTGKAGNFTDALLLFNLRVAERLKKAYNAGRLSRKIWLAGISYHQTLTPPTNPSTIEELSKHDYLHIFYPSRKDWSFAIGDQSKGSEGNQELAKNYKAWSKFSNLNLGVVEYNNKSNYAFLGITDMGNIYKNLNFYFPVKGSLYSYMHAVQENPGPLKLTNALMSNLCWTSSNVELKRTNKKIIERYFNKLYGPWSNNWAKVYSLMMISVSNAKHMFETESLNALLFQEIYWKKPVYSRSEVLKFIDRYRKGGLQELPNGFYGEKGSLLSANFIGLNESIGIQKRAKEEWTKVLLKVDDEMIKKRMEKDIMWFEAALLRYTLMELLAQYYGSNFQDELVVKEVYEVLKLLKESPIPDGLISKVNQRSFLKTIDVFLIQTAKKSE